MSSATSPGGEAPVAMPFPPTAGGQQLPFLHVILMPDGKVRLQGNVTSAVLGSGMLEEAKIALRGWVQAQVEKLQAGGGIQPASATDLQAIDKAAPTKKR